MQQFRRFRDVRDVGRRDDHGVNELAVPVRADVRLHPKIPLVAFARLVHFRIALLFLILGGRRGGQERGIHQGASTHHQTARGKIGVDGGEQASAEIVGFEQPAEFQEGGGVGHPVGGQINAGEPPHRLAVVDGIFDGFIGQTIPLLEEIHPQHALQTDGRTATLPLRIERFNDRQQPRPRNDFLHPRQKLFPAGNFLFSGKLGLRKTRLVRHALKFRKRDRGRQQ